MFFFFEGTSLKRKNEIDDVKEKLKAGEQPVFDNLDALFDKLEE